MRLPIFHMFRVYLLKSAETSRTNKTKFYVVNFPLNKPTFPPPVLVPPHTTPALHGSHAMWHMQHCLTSASCELFLHFSLIIYTLKYSTRAGIVLERIYFWIPFMEFRIQIDIKTGVVLLFFWVSRTVIVDSWIHISLSLNN